jgi:hypothetical protein
MKPVIPQAQTDHSHTWIGGEATVGSQAGRHIRRQAGIAKHLFTTILGLTFLGGVALGGAISLLFKK